jgi:hypothetical protein
MTSEERLAVNVDIAEMLHNSNLSVRTGLRRILNMSEQEILDNEKFWTDYALYGDAVGRGRELLELANHLKDLHSASLSR